MTCREPMSFVAEMRDLIGHEGADVAQTVLRHAGNREKGAASSRAS